MLVHVVNTIRLLLRIANKPKSAVRLEKDLREARRAEGIPDDSLWYDQETPNITRRNHGMNVADGAFLCKCGTENLDSLPRSSPLQTSDVSSMWPCLFQKICMLRYPPDWRQRPIPASKRRTAYRPAVSRLRANTPRIYEEWYSVTRYDVCLWKRGG